jgi:hypothetical protein
MLFLLTPKELHIKAQGRFASKRSLGKRLSEVTPKELDQA